jgi:hypothetical protein
MSKISKTKHIIQQDKENWQKYLANRTEKNYKIIMDYYEKKWIEQK